jgi:hypothetical protein
LCDVAVKSLQAGKAHACLAASNHQTLNHRRCLDSLLTLGPRTVARLVSKVSGITGRTRILASPEANLNCCDQVDDQLHFNRLLDWMHTTLAGVRDRRATAVLPGRLTSHGEADGGQAIAWITARLSLPRCSGAVSLGWTWIVLDRGGAPVRAPLCQATSCKISVNRSGISIMTECPHGTS